jgi:hypothetical protein
VLMRGKQGATVHAVTQLYASLQTHHARAQVTIHRSRVTSFCGDPAGPRSCARRRYDPARLEAIAVATVAAVAAVDAVAAVADTLAVSYAAAQQSQFHMQHPPGQRFMPLHPSQPLQPHGPRSFFSRQPRAVTRAPLAAAPPEDDTSG